MSDVSNSLARVGAGSSIIKIGDKSYQLTATTIGDMADMEAHLTVIRKAEAKEKLRDVIEACKDLPPELASQAIREEVANFRRPIVLSFLDIMEWTSTPIGGTFQLWCRLRRANPEIVSFDEAKNLIALMSEDDVAAADDAADVSAGVDAMGNSPSPTT